MAASAYRDTISFAKLTRHYGNGAAEAGEMPGRAFAKEPEYGIASGEAPAPLDQKPDHSLLTQTLMISIPRNFTVDFNVHGDRIERGDLARIKNQLDRWIEGLEELSNRRGGPHRENAGSLGRNCDQHACPGSLKTNSGMYDPFIVSAS